MNIYAIKTKKGFYITEKLESVNWSNSSRLAVLKVNGKQPEKTFHRDWFFTDSEPKSLTMEQSQPAINHRYELKSPEKFPDLTKVWKQEEVVLQESCHDNDYETIFLDSFKDLSSLYEYKCDTQPNIDVEVPFELLILAELEEIPEFKPFSYKVQKTQYSHEGLTDLTEQAKLNNLVDQIVVPSLLLHDKPCSLSSKQSYDIIRQHVKENIDKTVAVITSDYNFCFTVEKIIPLVDKESYLYMDIFGKGRRKKRPEIRYLTTRKSTVFEMTHDQEKYKGYTIIQGFKGNTQAELKENIDTFLKNLMKDINKGYKDCPTCKGVGVIDL